MNEIPQQPTEVHIIIDLATGEFRVEDNAGNVAEKVEISEKHPINRVDRVVPVTILWGHSSPGHIDVVILGIPMRIPIPQ